MYTKQITFKDENGKRRKKTLHFELDIRDMIVIDEILPGGFLTFYNEMCEAKDFDMLIFLIRLLVLTGYGEPVKGKQFDKTMLTKAKFKASIPYYEIIKFLSANGKESTKFMEQILPSSVVEEANYLYERTVEDYYGIDPLAFKGTNKTIYDSDLSKFGLKLKGDQK